MALALIGSLGTGELVVILGIALLMFGGRLPEVARSLGRSVNQFKRGLKDLSDEVDKEDAPPRYVPPKALPTTATVTTTTVPPIVAASTEAAREVSAHGSDPSNDRPAAPAG